MPTEEDNGDNEVENQGRNVQLYYFYYSKCLANVLLQLQDNLKVGQAAISSVSEKNADLLRVNN